MPKSNISRMVNLHRGSDWYGNCEICNKKVETFYHLSAYARDIFNNNTHESFGHLKCLNKIIEKEKIPGVLYIDRYPDNVAPSF